MNQLVLISSPTLPALVVAAGERASIRFLEFFAANIRNPHTRLAGRPELAFMHSDQFELAAYKGARLSFRSLGRPTAPAGSARRCALSRVGVAAARFSAPILRARHAGDRQARDKMSNGLIAAVAIAALCVIGSAGCAF
jgi:hypothetical protein